MSEAHGEPIPGELAARLRDDPWARALGVEYLEIRRGYCRLALTLRPHMLNFHGLPHGGVIFSVADIAFGAACNSSGGLAVALSMTIAYMTAVPADSRRLAVAGEVKQGNQAGFFEVVVTDEAGNRVAHVHGVAHRIQGRS